MSEQLGSFNSQPVDLFDQLVADLEVSSDVTVKGQRELLDAISQRHETERQAAGITLVAVDRLLLEAVGQDYKIRLRRVIPSTGTEQVFLRLSYADQNADTSRTITRNKFVTVATRTSLGIEPAEGFDSMQAQLAFSQADELLSLQAQGILPNMQPTLDGIFDLSTALMAAPRPTNIAPN